jgi:hypothetical protein
MDTCSGVEALTCTQTLCSVMKWCWSRLPGGVVSWDAYELFRIGESGKLHMRDAHEHAQPC